MSADYDVMDMGIRIVEGREEDVWVCKACNKKENECECVPFPELDYDDE